MQVFATSHQEIDETARIVALKCYGFVQPIALGDTANLPNLKTNRIWIKRLIIFKLKNYYSL
jgi:hypothetical protein